MAETAKILAPHKTVLIPDPLAGCPMADMINVAELKEFKAQYPDKPVVAYVNTSAEVKAESDICCTSANAVKIVESVDSDTVLFIPDKSLAAWVASHTSKKIIPYPGFCPTHHRILAEDVMHMKQLHPQAMVLAHPECTEDVLRLADVIASTSGIIRWAKEIDKKEFIICTENGILHRLQKENPEKRFYNPTDLNVCPNMKRITLDKVLWSLEDMEHEIIVPEDVAARAKMAIDRMLAVA